LCHDCDPSVADYVKSGEIETCTSFISLQTHTYTHLVTQAHLRLVSFSNRLVALLSLYTDVVEASGYGFKCQ